MTACAIDIGGTFTKVALVDAGGQTHHYQRIPTAPPLDRYLACLRETVSQVRANHPRANQETARGIGVSVAGFLDAAHTGLVYNPNLPWLERFALRPWLIAEFGEPVTLEVDSNAAALAEYRWGSGRGVERFLCLTVGTGIGGGFVAGGEILRITRECIGDVGHVIVNPGGRRCTCGGLGCAEAEASAPAILERAGLQVQSLEHLPRDAATELLFEQSGRYLGLLAASLASIFFPDRIALGGGVCAASNAVVAAAAAEFANSAGDWARRHTCLVLAQCGAGASLAGAGCLLLPEML